MNAGDVNSGPHKCTASILPTQSSPKPSNLTSTVKKMEPKQQYDSVVTPALKAVHCRPTGEEGTTLDLVSYSIFTKVYMLNPKFKSLPSLTKIQTKKASLLRASTY